MTHGRLAGQLDVLCLGLGATLGKIESEAPLLHSLPVTTHALDVLFDGEVDQISAAAREVLECVTKPRGAGGFDESTSKYVQAMLGINGAHKSFNGRMTDLVSGVDNDYLTDRDSWKRDRGELMAQLAAKLMKLDKFPCAPDARELASILAAAILVSDPDFFALDVDAQRDRLSDALPLIPGAVRILDGHGITALAEQRIAIVMRAVAIGPYRLVYDSLSTSDRDLMLPPATWADLFNSAKPREYRPSDLEVRRTSQIVARIVLDIEESEAWERVLLASESGSDGFELSTTQSLRVRALVARFTDTA